MNLNCQQTPCMSSQSPETCCHRHRHCTRVQTLKGLTDRQLFLDSMCCGAVPFLVGLMVVSFMTLSAPCEKSKFFVLWEEGKTIDGRVLQCLGFARVCTTGELQGCSLFWTFQVRSWTTDTEGPLTHSIRSAMRGSAVRARASDMEKPPLIVMVQSRSA